MEFVIFFSPSYVERRTRQTRATFGWVCWLSRARLSQVFAVQKSNIATNTLFRVCVETQRWPPYLKKQLFLLEQICKCLFSMCKKETSSEVFVAIPVMSTREGSSPKRAMMSPATAERGKRKKSRLKLFNINFSQRFSSPFDIIIDAALRRTAKWIPRIDI